MVGSAAIKQGRLANRKHTHFFFWPYRFEPCYPYFRPKTLPSIEEAWALPIPAELTSRQGSGTPHTLQKSPLRQPPGGPSLSPVQPGIPFGDIPTGLDDGKKKKAQARKRVWVSRSTL